MSREIPAVRILPMSDKHPAFAGRSIEDVQTRLFLRDLPRASGRWQYRRSGLNAEPYTLVLFQFKARIIAMATFMRDERFDAPRGKDGQYAGALVFDPKSFRTFAPVDVESMRKAWPTFRAFGHVKQALNPTRHADFKRRLKQVRSPG